MDKEDYGLLKWLPMPTLGRTATLKDQKYKGFEAAHANNEKPTDADRPGAKEYIENKVHMPPIAPFKYVPGYARMVVWCRECGKPRLLYTQKIMTDKIYSTLTQVLEKYVYSCGGPILPENHQLANTVFVQARVTCKTNISSQYYSRREMIEGFKLICFNCLRENDIAIEEEDITKQYKSFLPRCNDCKQMRKIAYTMKNNIRRQNNKEVVNVQKGDEEQKIKKPHVKLGQGNICSFIKKASKGGTEKCTLDNPSETNVSGSGKDSAEKSYKPGNVMIKIEGETMSRKSTSRPTNVIDKQSVQYLMSSKKSQQEIIKLYQSFTK